MFSQACVKNSAHKGVSVSEAGGFGVHLRTPPRHIPLLRQTPPSCRHPLHPSGRDPLRQTPVLYRQTPPQVDTHPRDGHCSGRYASYCDAFLFNENSLLSVVLQTGLGDNSCYCCDTLYISSGRENDRLLWLQHNDFRQHTLRCRGSVSGSYAM